MKNASWPWKPLGELFEIGAGKTMSRAAREGNGRVPFLRTSNVLWDEIDLSHLDEMALSPEELTEKCVATGDLLVCEGGEIGRAAIWNGDVSPLAFQNHLHRLRPRQGDVEPRFYVYFLHSAFTQLGIFEGAGNKTTIPNLSRNRLASLEVPHPMPDEQRAVSRALALVRNAVRGHALAAARADELKRAAMGELFTRGLRGGPQKETEIGPVPKSWDVVQLGTFVTRAQYGLSVRGQQAGQYPILRMNCQMNGRVVFRDLQFIDLDAKAFSAFRLDDGDLLFNRTNSYELVGRMSIFRSQREAVFASYLIRVTLDQDALVPEFVNYYFNQSDIQARLRALASRGVSQANINATKLKGILIPKPGLDEQGEIVAILTGVDRKVDLHRRKRALFEELYKSLLHKLMTGELRVSDLDLSALPAPAEANQ